MIGSLEREELEMAVEDALLALDEYRNGLEDRPARKSGHVPTKEELARWVVENQRFQELLAAYRQSVHRALCPEPPPCGEAREGRCNCTWVVEGVTHVCDRVKGHRPIYSYPEARPTGGHCCACGIAIATDARGVRSQRAILAKEAA